MDKYGEVIIYQTEDGLSKIEVSLKNETVWLSIDQMAELFQRDRSVIGKHVRNVFKEGELKKESVWAKFAYTAADGKEYNVDFYKIRKIAVLGLGVIGTTYAYALQKAGHETYHIVRESKRDSVPEKINVHVLDGRYNSKGEEKDDTYDISLVTPGERYDFILVSVASGKLQDAVTTIRNLDIKGTLILFCNFWNKRDEVKKIIGDMPFVTAFPTAGGHKENYSLNCVLFDHIMLENESKAEISNYADLIKMLNSADIKQEIPDDMFEWIWIHMAINAGVTSTAAREGVIDDPNRLARELMADSKALTLAVKTIRETLRTVEARGVDLKLYKGEIMPYKMPAWIAGIAMKKLFSGNELTSRIMTLHSDVNDILYGCRCVYDEGKKHNLGLPLFYKNMDTIFENME